MAAEVRQEGNLRSREAYIAQCLSPTGRICEASRLKGR